MYAVFGWDFRGEAGGGMNDFLGYSLSLVDALMLVIKSGKDHWEIWQTGGIDNPEKWNRVKASD